MEDLKKLKIPLREEKKHNLPKNKKIKKNKKRQGLLGLMLWLKFTLHAIDLVRLNSNCTIQAELYGLYISYSTFLLIVIFMDNMHPFRTLRSRLLIVSIIKCK